ncbi:MAG TPA: hypothetical protein VGL77_17695 [Armatimonadota bacterium]|jgi:hypothetical protein
MQTLFESIDLAGRTCLAWLNHDRDYLPTGGYEAAHDTGRWWDAMLRREAVTGLPIPAEFEGPMLRNLQRLTDNPDGLLMKLPDQPDLPLTVNPHNFREAMIAFHALVRYRNNAWAAKQGHRLLETIDRILQEDGRIDYTLLQTKKVSDDPFVAQPAPGEWCDSTASLGRSLEGIVWFYEATGDPLALRVAERIASHQRASILTADGSLRPELIDPEHVGHSHSFLGTLRGLLLFGFLTRQRAYIDAVACTYRQSVRRYIVTETGYVAHDLGKIRHPNKDGIPVGEHASCGDAIQLALWLALRDGQLDLLDDVERWMRACILPSQITERFPEAQDPRKFGAWGVYIDPYGIDSTHDVFAAVLHSVTDVYAHVVTHDTRGLAVNLLFSADGDTASVRVEYGTEFASVTVTPKVRDNVLIRVPGWAPRESVTLSVDTRPVEAFWIGPYLFIGRDTLALGNRITLTYALPERSSSETMRNGKNYRFTWRGDQVVASDPPTTIYPTSQSDSVTMF